nr:7724_t:CDS:2 [Entrophospora candida]
MDLKLICGASATNASTTEAATDSQPTQSTSLPPSEFGNDNNVIAPTSASQSHSHLQQFPSQQLTAVAVTSQPSSSSRSSTPSASPPQSHLQQGQLLTPPHNKDENSLITPATPLSAVFPAPPQSHNHQHQNHLHSSSSSPPSSPSPSSPSPSPSPDICHREMNYNHPDGNNINTYNNNNQDYLNNSMWQMSLNNLKNLEGHISDLINKTFEVLYALNALKDETIRKGPKRLAPPGRCHSCNIQETPEWRRGPDGARTLCNACGLHFAKLTRKRSQAAILEHQRFQEYYTQEQIHPHHPHHPHHPYHLQQQHYLLQNQYQPPQQQQQQQQ